MPTTENLPRRRAVRACRRRGLLFAPLLLLAVVPVVGQEAALTTEPPRFAAAGWCAVVKSSDAAEQMPDAIGCDIGVGLSMTHYRRLSWVAVIGSKSAGTGIAWVIPGTAPVVAVAIGAVVPYDAGGIAAKPQLAVGATLSFRGGD